MCAPLTARSTGDGPPRRARREARAGEVVEREVVDAHVGAAGASERHARRPPSRAAIAATRGSSALRIAVPVGGQRLDELGLGPGDAVDAADALGVRRGDRRDDADVRPGDVAQPADLAEAAHAHLQHEHLGVVRRAEDGHRQALLVVEAALVGGHAPAGADGGTRRGPWCSSCRRCR